MKILLCKSHFAGPVSGSDETLLSYATHLHKQGHRLTVVLLYAPDKSDQYYARLKQAGVEVITIVSHPFTELAQTILKLARDPILCETIGAENRKRIREQYDSRMCKETVAYLTAQR